MGGNHLQVPGMSLDGASDYGGRGSQPSGSPARSVGGRSQHGGSQHGASPARSVGGRSQHGGSQHGASPSRSVSGREQQDPSSRTDAGSRRGSQSSQPQQRQPVGYPDTLGYDPGRDPEIAKQRAEDSKRKMMKRIDLPAEAFEDLKGGTFAKRKGFNTSKAKDIDVAVNQFRIMNLMPMPIYQYDIEVNTDKNPDVILRKMWESKPWQDKLKSINPRDAAFLWNGAKICWSPLKIDQKIRATIDLDACNPREGSSGRAFRGQANTYQITMQYSTKIDLSHVQAYLKGQAGWNNSILEAMTFIDHAVRQSPSELMVQIGRSFYRDDGEPHHLSFYMGARKGIYVAARLNQSIGNGGMGIGVTVDVANTTFWHGDSFDRLIKFYLDAQNVRLRNRDIEMMAVELKPIKVLNEHKQWVWGQSEAFRFLRRLHRLSFRVQHKMKMADTKVYKLKQFAFSDKWGEEGGTAFNYRFTIKKTGEERTVYDHYRKQYNVTLQFPDLPVMETTRAGAFPPECCLLIPMQKYNFKLNAQETSGMIKFAVTRPKERAKHIMENVTALGWGRDAYLQAYGIKINPMMTMVKAKLLPNPEVQFGNGKLNPKLSGRWDLRGRTFVAPNPVPLKSWGVIINGNCCNKPAVEKFMAVFVDAFKKHGGKVQQPKPLIYTSAPNESINQAIEKLYTHAGKTMGEACQIIFVVLADKTQHVYERCKKSMECRYALVSQCMQKDHVLKANAQYCSNVAMKVMCKLGGQVSRVALPPGVKSYPWFANNPTMIIGADVSHGQGGQQINKVHPSMAAMVMSMDKDAAIYAAGCQSNGYRKEIINPIGIEQMLQAPAKKWREKMGIAPKHVFYFRDGVDEGAFARVVKEELSAIREVISKATGCEQNPPKITVIVATKRHHIRFFPDAKNGMPDKNSNPSPGTLIEKEVTHPFQYDFYLCSHVAIQGTARPVHYHVLIDEVGMPVNILQDMIYQHCYQYQRATTPVSLHPAVYYSHLAADRARAHEDDISALKDPKAPKKTEGIFAKKLGFDAMSLSLLDMDAPDLLPLGTKEADPRNVESIKYVPWYI